jgi:hypothetical protein
MLKMTMDEVPVSERRLTARNDGAVTTQERRSESGKNSERLNAGMNSSLWNVRSTLLQ